MLNGKNAKRILREFNKRNTGEICPEQNLKM